MLYLTCGDPKGVGGNSFSPSNTGPDPLKNHKATKPAFNVWPSSPPAKGHLNGVRVNAGPLLVVIEPSHPSTKKKRLSFDKIFWISSCLGSEKHIGDRQCGVKNRT